MYDRTFFFFFKLKSFDDRLIINSSTYTPSLLFRHFWKRSNIQVIKFKKISLFEIFLKPLLSLTKKCHFILPHCCYWIDLIYFSKQSFLPIKVSKMTPRTIQSSTFDLTWHLEESKTFLGSGNLLLSRLLIIVDEL